VPSSTVSVLLVENEILAQRVSVSMLEEIGCLVDVADSASQAIELANNQYDIIFMDLGLPDKSGVLVSKEIRENSQANRNAYIVALTAHAGIEEQIHCKEVGMNDFLTKPASLDDFKRVIADYSRKKTW